MAPPSMRIGRFRFTAPSWWATLATVVLLPALAALGVWQLDRADQKVALLHAFAARERGAPVHLSPRLAQLDLGHFDWGWWRYRPVEAGGRYDALHQYLLDNRTEHGIAGYHVFTPFEVSGTRYVVLVDRGWVPEGARRDRLPPIPVSSHDTVLRGLVERPLEPFTLGVTGYDAKGWPRVVETIDIARIGTQLRHSMLPFVVLLDPSQADGFVRHWTPYLGIGPERHRAYAFQWFSLAVALAAIYVVVNTKREQAPPA